MKKVLCSILVIALVIAVFAVTILAALAGPELFGRIKYREEKFIGRSSQEIREKYGKFDYLSLQDAPGLWRTCWCGYKICDKYGGFFGTDYPLYFMIYFNEEGIATKCKYKIMYPPV